MPALCGCCARGGNGGGARRSAATVPPPHRLLAKGLDDPLSAETWRDIADDIMASIR